jgi:hypothetical protein
VVRRGCRVVAVTCIDRSAVRDRKHRIRESTGRG